MRLRWGSAKRGCAKFLIIEARRRELAAGIERRLTLDFLVFVSYSWKDEEVARQVTEMLERRGIRYVQDRKDIKVGDRISDWAAEEIKRSSDYLLILTQASASSTWCHYEFGVAVGAGARIVSFVVEPEIEIPPFAAGHVFVRELRDLEALFVEARIDAEEVERLLEEILGLKLAELAAFVPRGSGEVAAWDASDREEHETRRERTPAAGEEGPLEVLGLELDLDGHLLVLEAKQYGRRTTRYELRHASELEAVVVTPWKEGSNVVGERDDSGDEEPRLLPGGRSVEAQLQGRSIYGWEASADFWAHAVRRLSEALPSGV